MESEFEFGITCSNTMRNYRLSQELKFLGESVISMLKSNGPNSILKDALRDQGCPWLINCTTQEHFVNVGLDSLQYASSCVADQTKHVDHKREEICLTPNGWL